MHQTTFKKQVIQCPILFEAFESTGSFKNWTLYSLHVYSYPTFNVELSKSIALEKFDLSTRESPNDRVILRL